jgi:hypothetical protein
MQAWFISPLCLPYLFVMVILLLFKRLWFFSMNYPNLKAFKLGVFTMGGESIDGCEITWYDARA